MRQVTPQTEDEDGYDPSQGGKQDVQPGNQNVARLRRQPQEQRSNGDFAQPERYDPEDVIGVNGLHTTSAFPFSQCVEVAHLFNRNEISGGDIVFDLSKAMVNLDYNRS